VTAHRRRSWDSLSAMYRRRLEKNGIGRTSYQAGVPLSGARGHAGTPERPERAERKPDSYRGYLRRRGTGMRMVTTDGVQIVQGLAQRERSLVGKHDNAVRNYLQAGREIPSPYVSKLGDFEGKTVRGCRPRSEVLADFEFETRETYLDYREGRGEVRFESIYEGRA